MKRLILILVLIASPVWAVQPDEVLSDPALEARARELSKDLRCLVCRNESIDESNAPLARDLRILLRERLVAGDTDQEAMDYLVDRFGEYVLLRPQLGGTNLILWLAAPIALIVGLGIGFAFLRRKSKAPAPTDDLSEEEQQRLAEILRE